MVNVVYIAGSGRIGSTLVTQVLGAAPNWFAGGQIRDFSKSYKDESQCTCGQTIPTCDFWGEIGRRLTGEFGNDVFDRVIELRKAYSRDIDWSLDLTAGAGKDMVEKHGLYLSILQRIYTEVGNASGCDYVVDDSKSPDVAHALQLVEGVELYCIMLVRDPRAVASSWSKKFRKKKKIVERARLWNKRYRALSRFEQLIPSRMFRLAYEEFADNPEKCVQSIQNWASGASDDSMFVSKSTVSLDWESTHLCPPINPEIAEQKKKSVLIRVSQSWHDEKYAAARQIAEKINFPFARKFGYKKGI